MPYSIEPARVSAGRQGITDRIRRTLPDARLIETPLSLCPEISLYLIDPANMRRPFASDEIRIVLANTPYWIFCWAGGQALARYLLDHPAICAGKRVLDFGAGSGVVAIAAKLAGAATAVACDIDDDALAAVTANAELNRVDITTCRNPTEVAERFDLVLAADVLYDRENLRYLETLLNYAPTVLMADSRVKNIDVSPYRKLAEITTTTLPDLEEPDHFNRVILIERIDGARSGLAGPQFLAHAGLELIDLRRIGQDLAQGVQGRFQIAGRA